MILANSDYVSGNSYTTTTFNVDGTQPSASNPMGNPTLGQFDLHNIAKLDTYTPQGPGPRVAVPTGWDT